MIFEKKYLKKNEIKKLVKRVIDETQLMDSVLQLLEDSGNYKKRINYKISDCDLREKIQDIRSKLIQLQVNMIFADIIIGSNKKLYQQYQILSEKINEEILKKSQDMMTIKKNKEEKANAENKA